MADRPTPEELTTLGEHVRSVRSSMSLSIDAVAGRAPMSPVTWSKVERGEPVNPSTYAGVERSLGWSQGSIDLFFHSGYLPTGHDLELTEKTADELEETVDDLRLINDLPVSASTKLALMRQYLRLAQEAHHEAVRERRRSA